MFPIDSKEKKITPTTVAARHITLPTYIAQVHDNLYNVGRRPWEWIGTQEFVGRWRGDNNDTDFPEGSTAEPFVGDVY